MLSDYAGVMLPGCVVYVNMYVYVYLYVYMCLHFLSHHCNTILLYPQHGIFDEKARRVLFYNGLF